MSRADIFMIILCTVLLRQNKYLLLFKLVYMCVFARVVILQATLGGRACGCKKTVSVLRQFLSSFIGRRYECY